jgi:hypothetical protein
MRGKLWKTSALFNMVDGIFAVAITLIPISIPNHFLESNERDLLLLNASILVIGLTMALMWHKLRSVLKVSSPVNSIELALVGIVCILAVMIPKCAFLAFKYGSQAADIWHWNISQSVNIEYQGLIIVYELIVLMLMARGFQKKSAAKYTKFQINGFKSVEVIGLALIVVIVICENTSTSVNGIYLYFVPAVLAMEEIGYIWVNKKSREINKKNQLHA